MQSVLKWLGFVGLSIAFPPSAAFAAALHDYRGTMGMVEIGLTIAAVPQSMSQPLTKNGIIGAQYFYVSQLGDIPLKLISFSERDISFEEDDANGKAIATLKLSFAKQDPQHHFQSKDDLQNEVLVGNWIPASGQAQEVYLASEDTVTGDGSGGRCDLDAASYATLQSRVALFYGLAMKGDGVALQKEFKTKIPKQASWHKELAKSVPHNLFCNAQGFMLGRGIVWFNPDGSVLRINKF